MLHVQDSITRGPAHGESQNDGRGADLFTLHVSGSVVESEHCIDYHQHSQRQHEHCDELTCFLGYCSFACKHRQRLNLSRQYLDTAKLMSVGQAGLTLLC